jgi:hypothetical protein
MNNPKVTPNQCPAGGNVTPTGRSGNRPAAFEKIKILYFFAGPADKNLTRILNWPFNTPTIHENQETPRKILL